MSRRRTAGKAWRSLMTLSALAIFLSTLPAAAEGAGESSATAQPEELLAREVRTVPGRDLGVVTPLDIAYDAAAEAFIVAGQTSSGSAIVQVPRTWNPTEVSPTRVTGPVKGAGDLTATDPADGLTYELSSDGTRLEAFDGSGLVAVYDASSVGLEGPTSMTFAPSTDVTDSAENQNLFIANATGVTEVTLQQEVSPTATTATATLIQSFDTSVWSPPSTDPSGIVWDSRVDELFVVDSEVNETTLYEGVNLWKINRSGTVLSTGVTTGYSDEPTGVGLDTANDTLFITDDTGTRSLYVVTAGTDGVLGTSDDASSAVDLTGFSDPEDPEYHVNEGVVYLLSGVDLEIVRVDPNDGIFGNGNDTITSFDISHLGPTDFEGLTHAPNRGTLYVGARNGNHIFEITTTGTLLRTIDVNASGLGKISGLAMAPSSTDPSVPSLWNVDRGSDEVNDGKVFELAVPDLDDPETGNNPPTASFTYTCTGLTCDFSDTSTDSDGTVVAWSWDFGDTSGTSTAQNPTYTYASGGTYTVSLTVTDDSSGTDTTSQDVTVSETALPEVTVTASDATAAEPSDNGEFTFTRTGDTSGPLTVSYTVGGTATNGTDYDSLSGSVVISDAQASVAVPVTVIDDGLAEDSETVTATVVAGSGYAVGSPSSATVTIADDGDAPVGSTTFEVRVAESTDDAEENPSGSVDLTSSDLELVETRNFAQTVGMRFVGVQVPQGATVTNAWIQFQVDETSSVSTDLVLRAQAADSAGTFSTNSGDLTSRPMTSASASWSPVAWNTVGEAGPDQMTPDLSALIQEVVNRPGWSSGNALAIIAAGTGSRVAESFNGDSAGAPLLHVEYGSGSVTPVVSVSATDADAGEPSNDGEFTFTRTGDTTNSLTVDYTVGGTATGGSDYAALSGSVSIPSGQASVAMPVVVSDDAEVEGSETVVVTVADGVDYDVGSPSSDTVTIADDDVPSVSVSASDSVAGEPADDGEFTFSRTDTAGSLTIHYTVSGTATAGSDYVALSGSVSIPDGQPSATVLVDVLDDSDPESTETVVVTISASAAYTVGSPSSDTVTITDDGDLPEVTVTATDSSAAEPSDNGAFTFTRSGPTTDSLTVNYAVTGTATNGSDYMTLSGSITIPSGQASATETVVVVDDSEIEGAETVVVTIDPDLAYTIGTPGSDTVTIEDDDGSNMLEVRVANGDDDAEEDPRGKVSLNSPDLKLVERNGRFSTQVVGIRFAGVALPQGATITKAWVQFTTDEANSVRTDLTIRAQAADNPNTFTNVDFDVSSRPTTTASVAWSPPAWNTVDQAGTGQQTPDLKTVIQEIVDRPGWQSGYAIAVIVTGTGSRTAESYNGDSEAAPLLHIEYTMP